MADEEKPAEKAGPTMEERLAALEAELKAERDGRATDRQRTEMLETTLRALGTTQTPRSAQSQASGALPFNPGMPSPEDIAFLRSLYPNYDDQALAQYWQQQQAVLLRAATPILNQVFGALGNAADILDRHDALLEVEEYKPNRKEVDTIVRESREAGRPISRTEATQILKARKLPELVQQEVERRTKEADERRAAAASAATETGTVATARPSPAAAPRKKLAEMSDQERDSALQQMKPADRIAAMEAELGETPIP